MPLNDFKMCLSTFMWDLKCLYCLRKAGFLKIRPFRRKKSLILVLLLVVPTFFVLFYSFYLKCSHSEVEKAVAVACNSYFAHESLGSFCSDICHMKSLKTFSCIPNHAGKDVVFSAFHNGRHVVIKSKNLDVKDFDQVFWTEKNKKFYPSLDLFKNMLFDSVTRNLNLQINASAKDNLIKVMWSDKTLNLEKFPGSMQHVLMNNLWSLVQQSEYLMLKYYSEKQVFPKILGSCGHFYVEEFVKPLDNWFLMLYPAWHNAFFNRAKLALKIINYLDLLEKEFGKLQLCDVKVAHFGVDDTGKIKLLDLDMVFYESSLLANMVSTQNCTNDEDCSFMDCQGSCNRDTQECKPFVVNSNLQRICKNVFVGRIMPKYFGLLSSPSQDISQELELALHKCSTTNDKEEILRIKEQLKMLLGKVVANLDKT